MSFWKKFIDVVSAVLTVVKGLVKLFETLKPAKGTS